MALVVYDILEIDGADLRAQPQHERRSRLAQLVDEVEHPALALSPLVARDSWTAYAALREEWLAGAADLACRKWRERHPGRVSWFDTDNQRYALDVDTPEDLDRFAASTGHRLSWPAAYANSA